MKINLEAIANEMIKYQNNDDFPNKLTTKIENIYKEIKDGIYTSNKILIEESKNIKNIEKLIKDRFNMNIVFDKELHSVYPAAIIPFFSDYLYNYKSLKNLGSDIFSKFFNYTNFIKYYKEIEKEREKILDKLHNKKGYIDLKNARVGGYLSELKHYLIIDFFYLFSINISPSEITAIILHEIGHAFTGLEYHHKLETTNSTIADILNEINKNNYDKAIYIFKRHFTKKEFDDISISNKKEIYDFYGRIVFIYLNEIKTQMVNYKYDETNYENLSDSFATRFNIGEDLTSGLHKLQKEYGLIYDKTSILYIILYFLDIFSFILSLILYGPVYVIIVSTIIGILFYDSDNYVMSYDFPIDRYNRIKNSIINNLKDINLPDKLVKDLISQYTFITETIEKSAYFKNIDSKIADLILSSNRNNNYYIKLQQSIENGLNNLLFLKTQQIRVLN